LDPKFVFVNQFNQFINNDGGYTVPARLDVEPTSDGSTAGYTYMKSAIADYIQYVGGTTNPTHFDDISIRGQTGPGNDVLNFDFVISGATPEHIYLGGMGPSLLAWFNNPNNMPAGSFNDVVFAGNPSFAFNGTSSLTGDTISVNNSDYSSESTPTTNPGYTDSALLPRVFKNSPKYFTYLNYNVGAPTSAEPGITADIDPGTYTVLISDLKPPSEPPQGTMTHARLTLGDKISGTRVINFSGRGYVKAGGNNVLILGFSLAQAKTFWIQALGPELGYSPYGLSPVLSANLTTGIYDPNSTLDQALNQNGIKGPWSGEAANQVTLQKGSYTVIVSNPGGSGNPDGIGQLTIQETEPTLPPH